MINDTYPYYPSEDYSQFLFISEGEQGKILKIILFEPLGNNEWNLGFGDLKHEGVDDSVMSSNHDAMKIIRTVARTTLDFCQEHPETILQIKPVDSKRGKLYNLVFQKYFTNIDAYFNIIGFTENVGEKYSPQKFYDYFKISFKFVK